MGFALHKGNMRAGTTFPECLACLTWATLLLVTLLLLLSGLVPTLQGLLITTEDGDTRSPQTYSKYNITAEIRPLGPFQHYSPQSAKTAAKRRLRLGYLTGSQTRNKTYYKRPGQAISGAITLAVDQINNSPNILPDHVLELLIAETYGQEKVSIRRTVELATYNVSAYIGPQETCIHEGRIAAAFNLPMISYVSKNPEIFI